MSVYIGIVEELKRVKNADNIALAKVVCGRGGIWHGIVRKEDFAVGNLCEVYLPDTILPKEERFLFMEKLNYIVSPTVIRGVISEALIMPLTVDGLIGQEISDKVGAYRYIKPVNFNSGKRKAFPPFIPKTDEPDVQGVLYLFDELKGTPYYITEKVDGTSCTVYYYNGHFGVCSRNYEIEETEGNQFWALARAYELDKRLKTLHGQYAIQFEVAGPGVNKNPLGLEGIKPFLFNIYDIDKRKYVSYNRFFEIAFALEFPTVVFLEDGDFFDYSIDQIIEKSIGYYQNGAPREGIVVRPKVETKVKNLRLSFKVRNPYY